jgi:hypothetical protein
LAQAARAARQEAPAIKVSLGQVLFLELLHLLAAGMELELITLLAAVLAVLVAGQAALQQVYITAALRPPPGKEMLVAATALRQALSRLLVVAAQARWGLMVLEAKMERAVTVQLRQLAVLP